jgi:oxygenase
MICGLDIRYDVGDGDSPLLGARLPHTALTTHEGPTTTTTALLRTGRGILLDLSGGHDAPPEAAIPESLEGQRRRGPGYLWADRVTTVAARPEPGSPLDGVDRLLVRPDGYIAWAGPAVAGPHAALRRWFGPPAA